MSGTLLTGWGRTAPTRPALVARPRSAAEIRDLLSLPLPRGLITRGLGRAYGDAAQCAGGVVAKLAGDLRRNVVVDRDRGVAHVAAGMSYERLIEAALPLGWF